MCEKRATLNMRAAVEQAWELLADTVMYGLARHRIAGQIMMQNTQSIQITVEGSSVNMLSYKPKTSGTTVVKLLHAFGLAEDQSPSFEELLAATDAIEM